MELCDRVRRWPLIDPQILKFEDSTLPFDLVRRSGYYQVGSKFFVHKTYALIEATKTNQEISWEFNTDIYKKINWRQPITLSIQEIYRMRAQQLRDKYDYLILAFSGGADSTNVLDSFLLNNIHLDEIIVHWPLKYTQGKYQVSRNTIATNILSEWELAVVPKLDFVRKHYPAVKITISDTDDLSDETTEDIFTLTRDKFDYANIKRNRAIFKASSQLLNKGINVATIFALDKPVIIVTNGVFGCHFQDSVTPTLSGFHDGYERNIECFYSTPDMPEITVKQAQMLYEYFKARPDQRSLLRQDDRVLNKGDYTYAVPVNAQNIFRALASSILYPTWDSTTFQADKPENFIKCEHHAWTRSHGKQDFLESWQSALLQNFNLIDRKFFTQGDIFKSYLSCSSRVYPLGYL